jgi:hypothetical protein
LIRPTRLVFTCFRLQWFSRLRLHRPEVLRSSKGIRTLHSIPSCPSSRVTEENMRDRRFRRSRPTHNTHSLDEFALRCSVRQSHSSFGPTRFVRIRFNSNGRATLNRCNISLLSPHFEVFALFRLLSSPRSSRRTRFCTILRSPSVTQLESPFRLLLVCATVADSRALFHLHQLFSNCTRFHKRNLCTFSTHLSDLPPFPSHLFSTPMYRSIFCRCFEVRRRTTRSSLNSRLEFPQLI